MSLANAKPTKPAAPAVLNIGAPETRRGRLKALAGSMSDDLNNALLQQVISTAWLGHSDEAGKLEKMQANVAAMEGIGPKSEIEGMLAAQMVATHNAAMECYRRAMLPEQTFQGRESNLLHATRLTRSYATLVQALDKHRGRGQQTVRVEHVHIHPGAQAIVGPVSPVAPTLPGQGNALSALGCASNAPFSTGSAGALEAVRAACRGEGEGEEGEK